VVDLRVDVDAVEQRMRDRHAAEVHVAKGRAPEVDAPEHRIAEIAAFELLGHHAPLRRDE